MNKFNSFRWLKPKTSFALLCNRNFLKNPSQRRTLIAREFNTSQITTNQPSSQAIDEEPVHQGEHYIQVPKRGLMELAGEDTMKFLQGLITNDIKSMNTGVNVFYTAFLNSMGRVLFDAFIYQKNGSPEPVFLVECDLRIIPEFTKHLKKYLLRSKVAIKDVSSEYKIWNIWGNKNILDNLTLNSTLPKSGYVDQRCAGMGLRIVMPANMKPNLTSNFTELPSEEYVIRRILHGVPEGIDDFVPEKALPLQSNFDYMGGIDFRKGCYIGQELTFRTYHTGVTRRRILPIQLYPFDATDVPTKLSVDRNIQLFTPTPYSDIHPYGQSGRVAGNIGVCSHNVALALIKLDKIDVDDLVVYAEEKKQIYRVKPFMPNWWPQDENEQKQK